MLLTLFRLAVASLFGYAPHATGASRSCKVFALPWQILAPAWNRRSANESSKHSLLPRTPLVPVSAFGSATKSSRSTAARFEFAAAPLAQTVPQEPSSKSSCLTTKPFQPPSMRPNMLPKVRLRSSHCNPKHLGQLGGIFCTALIVWFQPENRYRLER